MTLGGKQKMAKKAEEILSELDTHRSEHGGTGMIVVAPPGSGKTTLLITQTKGVCYISGKNKEPETVIWRGREFDYFPAINKKGLVLHFAQSDWVKGVSVMYEDSRKAYPLEDYTIRLYKDIPHLNENIVKNKVNWVYPPSQYHVSKELKKILNRTGMKDADIQPEEFKNNAFWWFELWYYLSHYKKVKFLSLFIDEAQQIFPVSPSGIQWHVNQYLFKTLFADARKRNISVYCACHGLNEVDGRIINHKLPYKVYMQGATVAGTSLIWRSAPKTELRMKGDFYIESPSGWGMGHVAELPRTDVVVVEFNATEESEGIYEPHRDDQIPELPENIDNEDLSDDEKMVVEKILSIEDLFE